MSIYNLNKNTMKSFISKQAVTVHCSTVQRLRNENLKMIGIPTGARYDH